MDIAQAERLARIALGHVTQAYPHKPDHVLVGDEDGREPRDSLEAVGEVARVEQHGGFGVALAKAR